jgi:hypothetical protein
MKQFSKIYIPRETEEDFESDNVVYTFDTESGERIPKENLDQVNNVIVFTPDELKLLIEGSIITGYVNKEVMEGNILITSKVLAKDFLVSKNITYNDDYKQRIGMDNICPITKKPCDDETCPPGAECNISGDNIQTF